MDADLRRAEREGDWRAQATALKRAGRANEARRVVSEAVRIDSEAWSLLDAWFPLSDEERGLLAQLVRPVGGVGLQPQWARIDSAKQLLGVGDPRFDAALRDFDDPDLPDLGPLLRFLLDTPGSFSERIVQSVEAFGAHVLARSRPTSDEALALLEAYALPRPAEARELPTHLQRQDQMWVSIREPRSSDLVALTVLNLAGRYGDGRVGAVLERLLEDEQAHPILRLEAWSSLRLRGLQSAATMPHLPDGRPLRPAWIDGEAPMSALRDPLTLTLHRRFALQRWASEDEVAGDHEFLMIDQDDFKRFNDRHGHEYGDDLLRSVSRILQRHFGDRVIRYSGDEWLVPWKGRGLAEAAEAARAEVATLPSSEPTGDCHGLLRVRISGGIGRSIRAADEALYQAKADGKDRIVVG